MPVSYYCWYINYPIKSIKRATRSPSNQFSNPGTIMRHRYSESPIVTRSQGPHLSLSLFHLSFPAATRIPLFISNSPSFSPTRSHFFVHSLSLSLCVARGRNRHLHIGGPSIYGLFTINYSLTETVAAAAAAFFLWIINVRTTP